MKNLMLFVSPKHDFLEEHKIATKIQIDNSLILGWKKQDLILATNFPYEYRGIKSLLVSDETYAPFCPTVSIFNVIVELFEQNLIEKDELYWYHDHDAYELSRITESELDLGNTDMGIVDRGPKPKLDTGLMYFKSGAENIFRWVKELAYKYQVNEEYAITALYTNNLLWITETESAARQKFVPMNIPGAENLSKRIKKLDLRYLFSLPYFDLIYQKAKKPIKVAHFHFTSDLLLDSALYGKNSINKPLVPKRLVKIFNRHGVKRVPKKLKNLMIYLNPEKKFLDKTEDLVKIQIENSLELGWKKEDIMFLTNFPYEYYRIKATVVADSLFCNINDKASKANAIFRLLEQGVVKEGELWWFHDLDVFQLRPIKSSEIDLEATTAGFTDCGYSNKFDTGSFFFRNGSQKLFEWMRNRACRLNADESIALMSLSTTNYRNINSLYKRLNITHNFSTRLGSSLPDNNIPERLMKIFKKHGIK